MADINYTYDVYDPDGAVPDVAPAMAATDAPTSLGGMVRMAGAVASLALVLGVGVWGYKLVARDVSGVPVVRALEGPMRIQPDDPGGLQADHQGLAVNAVAADGTAAPTADRLMLAPAPVDLAEEDAPIGQIATLTPSQETPEDSEANTEELSSMSVEALVAQLTGQRQEPNDADEAAATPEDQASVQPVVPANDAPATDQADVLPEVLTDEPATDETAADEAPDEQTETQAAVVTGPGVTRSLRPLARPARLLASTGDTGVLTTALDGAVDTSAQIEVDAASLPVGTRLAQLGAYDGADVARGEWDKMTIKFKDYFDGKQRVIQKASSGGRTFYRLRAMGFEDLSAARRFCSALVSENADCIPVTTR